MRKVTMRICSILYLLLQSILVFSQIGIQEDTSHVLTFRESIVHGETEGNFRSFFMATDNTRDLSDYYALALGGSLSYTTKPFHGFSLGLGGDFTYNVVSSDFTKKDSITGAVSRYELGLFDIVDAENKKAISRLHDLWLKYSSTDFSIVLGQQALNTPFINVQDGRMNTSSEAGVWIEIQSIKKTIINGGYLWALSPRSTTNWYSISKSIGLYPKGNGIDGSPSGYFDNLNSNGIALLGLSHQFTKQLNIQIWDQYVDNIYNTVFFQSDYQLKLKNDFTPIFGFQYCVESRVGNGGNDDIKKAYYQSEGQARIMSAQIGFKKAQWQWILAYTSITNGARFLSPREWGKEPFYTFMPRERIEGSSNTSSAVGKLLWNNKSKKLKIETAYGHYFMPDAKDVAHNKYGFPEFSQLNIDIKYSFENFVKGLNMQLLLVRKFGIGETYNNDKFVINKVDMSNINIVFNYRY